MPDGIGGLDHQIVNPLGEVVLQTASYLSEFAGCRFFASARDCHPLQTISSNPFLARAPALYCMRNLPNTSSIPFHRFDVNIPV